MILSTAGAAVFLSEWWIREHWQRAFEIIRFEPSGFAMGGGDQAKAGQGVVVMRPRAGDITVADLERPGNPERELRAALFSRDWAYEEIAQMAQQLRVGRQHEQARRHLEERVRDLSRELEVTTASKSWRLTRPLRRIARVARGGHRAARQA